MFSDFSNFWSTKPWIRIGIQPKMLDPDPKHCFEDRQNVPKVSDPDLRIHTTDLDPDPGLFVSDLQDANKK